MKMIDNIFMTSTSIRRPNIADSIKELYELGYNNIELSGGSDYSDSLRDSILKLKQELKIKLRCHNYFPLLNNTSSSIYAVMMRMSLDAQRSLFKMPLFFLANWSRISTGSTQVFLLTLKSMSLVRSFLLQV